MITSRYHRLYFFVENQMEIQVINEIRDDIFLRCPVFRVIYSQQSFSFYIHILIPNSCIEEDDAFINCLFVNSKDYDEML